MLSTDCLLQSWVYGKLIEAFAPETVALHSSRGIETVRGKLLMRWSVILSDLLGERALFSSCSTSLKHESRLFAVRGKLTIV